ELFGWKIFMYELIDVKHELCENLSLQKTGRLSENQRLKKQQTSSRADPAKMTSDMLESDLVLERKQKALQDQYAALLKEKVQRQRQEMKASVSDKTGPRKGNKDQKSTSVQKLTRSTLIHDDTYLRFLPKTQHYLVLELQKQLRRLGYLQSRREQEVFKVWTERHRSKAQVEWLKTIEHSSPDVTLEDLLKHNSGSAPKLQVTRDESLTNPKAVSVIGGGVCAAQLQEKQIQGQEEIELLLPEILTRKLKMPKLSSLQSTFLREVNPSLPLKDVEQGFSHNVQTNKSAHVRSLNSKLREKGSPGSPESIIESPKSQFTKSLQPAGKSTKEF
ncbi:hypothetical protein DNTS_018615, partial [Danionella cerebrum]